MPPRGSEARGGSAELIGPCRRRVPLPDSVWVQAFSRAHPDRISEFGPIFRELHLERRFPFVLRDGETKWVIITSESKIRTLIERLGERAPNLALQSLRPSGLGHPNDPLTARQTELLRRARPAGHFEMPGRITLSELAKSPDIATSSFSEDLGIVESKPASSQLREHLVIDHLPMERACGLSL